jgi:hypothetical protein
MVDHPTPLTPADRRVRSAEVRAQALAMRQSGATYAAIGAAVGGVSGETARQIVRKAERLINNPRWSDGLPSRAQTFLHISGLTALSEAEATAAVAQLSRRELLSRPNVGKGAAAALADWLTRHGHTFHPGHGGGA